jgi:mannose-6-phosphate isomerase-like protein (cupin superfamily)
MPLTKVNLAEKFSRFRDTYSPKIAGEVNDSYIKLVKVKGEFVWHQHEEEDEMFLVMKGRLVIRLRDGDVTLEPGEFLIVPRGVEHCPIAEEEAHVVLLEPKSTLNTGDVRNELTLEKLERI